MEIKEKIWSRNEKMAYLFLDYSIALAKTWRTTIFATV